MSIRESFEGVVTLQCMEQYLTRIEQSKPKILRIPFTPKVAGFACDVAFVQMVTTWAQGGADRKLATLLLHGNESYEQRLERFIKRPVGLLCAAVAPSVIDDTGYEEPQATENALEEQLSQYREHAGSTQLSLFGDDEVSEGRFPE